MQCLSVLVFVAISVYRHGHACITIVQLGESPSIHASFLTCRLHACIYAEESSERVQEYYAASHVSEAVGRFLTTADGAIGTANVKIRVNFGEILST